MKEIITDRYIIKLISYETNIDMLCPDTCFYISGNKDNDCRYRKELSIGENDIKINIIKLLIKNVSDKLIEFRTSRFDVIDSLGFTHKVVYFCDNYFKDKRQIVSSYELPPNTQMYFTLVANEFDDNTTLSKICFTDNNNHFLLIVDDTQEDDISLDDLKVENLKLKKEINSLQSQLGNETNDEIHNRNIGFQQRIINNPNPIKYRTDEDNEYFYIISNENSDTISFSRNFDKKKSNYNWVNFGDPLITLRFDTRETFGSYTYIKSPTTGIFEFDKKNFIKQDELICRIKKYDQEQKEEIFNQLEKEAIKQAIYKKEIKKQIEREALDELIRNGLIFNRYIKDGKRELIPQDIMHQVWNRDGGACVQCGSRENLEFDHIIPVSKGGATTYRNLQLLCKECNAKKSNNI